MLFFLYRQFFATRMPLPGLARGSMSAAGFPGYLHLVSPVGLLAIGLPRHGITAMKPPVQLGLHRQIVPLGFVLRRYGRAALGRLRERVTRGRRSMAMPTRICISEHNGLAAPSLVLNGPRTK